MGGLCSFGAASAFRRACMSMMAWSLTLAERSKVRDAFLELDVEHTGAIKFHEFKEVLQERFGCSDEHVEEMFESLSTGSGDEIRYSDFLAAMVCSSQVDINEDLLKATFRRFDTDNSGFITVKNLRDVLGETWNGDQIAELVREASTQNGRISYKDWIEYLHGDGLTVSHLRSRTPSCSIPMGSSKGSGCMRFSFVSIKSSGGRRRRRLG